MEKIYFDPDLGPVILRKNRRSRRVTLRVGLRGEVRVTIPLLTSYRAGVRFFLANKDWALKALRRRRERMGDEPAPTPSEIEAMRAEAKRVLPARLRELADEYSFEYNQVRVKRNVSNWGSCSRKGNINLNLSLVRLPDDLRDYVLLHELCHLRHPDHGPAFRSLLESLCHGHREKEKELKKHRIF